MLIKNSLILNHLMTTGFIVFLLSHLNACGPIDKSQTSKVFESDSSEVVFQTSVLDPEHSLEFQKLLEDTEKSQGEVTDVLPNGDLVVRYPTAEEANAAITDAEGVVSYKRSDLKKSPELLVSKEQGPFKIATSKESFTEFKDWVRPHTSAELKTLGSNRVKVALAKKSNLSKKMTKFIATELPSRVDLSESEFFPGIGNQGPLGSCVAWANSYYTNSFEYSKSTRGTGSACSPGYIFTLALGGKNPMGGIDALSALYVQSMMGCAGVNEVPPLVNVNSKGQYDENYFPSVKNQIEGMKRRISGVRFFLSLNEGERKSLNASTGEQRVQEIKAVLNAGYWIGGLNVLVYDDFDYYFGKRPCDQDKVYLFGRCLNQSTTPPRYISFNGNTKFDGIKFVSYHAVSIAGYDDNKEYTDLQGQKKKGAFKIANQWGTGWGDQGFFWVAYDDIRKGRRPVGDLDRFRDEGRVWPKDQEGFPDENHSVVSGTLYYITGIKKGLVKHALQVKFNQTTDEVVAYQIQVGAKSKIFKAGVVGSESWSWAKEGRLSESESLTSLFPKNVGLRVKKNQELTLVHNISDLLKDVEYPVEIQVTAIAPTEGGVPGTEILDATLHQRSMNGFMSKPLGLVQVSKDPSVYRIRLVHENDLPKKPQTGSFCAPNGTITLYYCGGDEPQLNGKRDPSWVDQGASGCYHHATSIRCDTSGEYRNCKTSLGTPDGQLNIRACGCSIPKTRALDKNWILGGKNIRCYFHPTGVLSF